jgi:hypothetical protein
LEVVSRQRSILQKKCDYFVDDGNALRYGYFMEGDGADRETEKTK